MREKFTSYDVIVVGSGLAAAVAALNAKTDNLNVLQVMNTGNLSGSSFSGYTWGLGIIGPETGADEKSLIDSIEKIGLEMTSKAVVKTLVENISESIDYLKSLGLKLEKNHQKTIPCFDYKSRQWYGLMKEKNKEILERALRKNGIKQKKNVEIVEMENLENLDLNGFLLTGLNHQNKKEYYYAKSVILATGGLSYLFETNFASTKAVVNGHYLAMQCGCNLSNLEFFQWIPSYQWPIKNRIFNEYTFRDVDLSPEFLRILEDENTTDLEYEEILKLRSSHGPFTSRLASKAFDIALVKFNKSNNNIFQYKKEMNSIDLSMVSRYFEWLEEETDYKKEKPFKLKMAAHASNGGIIINSKAETNIRGLYAAGEVTTGMEGADRMGGLATASAITFGSIAGRASKDYVLNIKEESTRFLVKNYIEEKVKAKALTVKEKQDYSTCDLVIQYSKKIMTTYGGIIRSEEGLIEGISLLEELKKILIANQKLFMSEELRNYYRAESMVSMDLIILKSMLLRRESRGSHYRSDYPEMDSLLAQQIIIDKKKSALDDQLKSKSGDYYE